MTREIDKDKPVSAVEGEHPRAETNEPSPEAAEDDTGERAPAAPNDDAEPVAACEDEANVITKLAAMSPIAYDRARRAAAEQLGVSVQAVDAEVRAERASQAPADDRMPFADPEPWPEPVYPVQLFNEIVDLIRMHVVLEPEQSVAVAFWVVHTYLQDSLEVAPLLLVNAPERACGKSLLQSLLARVCRRPLLAANISTSALFRAVERWRPTLFIDEADHLFRDNPELLGLVNAGHGRDGFVLRSVPQGDGFEVRPFSVFGPKSIAGIALERHLPDSTMSRGIVINMRRKLPHEKVERLRDADPEEIETIRSKLARFALDHAAHLRSARPPLPHELSDRAQDNWHALLACAQCAGQACLDDVTEAAIILSGAGEAPASIGNQLLGDIRRAFDGRPCDRIPTGDLIDALSADDERPWSTYDRGRRMTPRQLARLLSAYGIKSRTVRMSASRTPKGYIKADFEEAFARYLPPPEQQRPSRGPEVIDPAEPGDWPDEIDAHDP